VPAPRLLDYGTVHISQEDSDVHPFQFTVKGPGKRCAATGSLRAGGCRYGVVSWFWCHLVTTAAVVSRTPHQPSGIFAANAAWAILAAITHNLLRAAATLTGTGDTAARGATLRRAIINVPARLARPGRRPVLHLPTHWPHTIGWNRLCRNVFTT
jgi:hypothetical protein